MTSLLDLPDELFYDLAWHTNIINDLPHGNDLPGLAALRVTHKRLRNFLPLPKVTAVTITYPAELEYLHQSDLALSGVRNVTVQLRAPGDGFQDSAGRWPHIDDLLAQLFAAYPGVRSISFDAGGMKPPTANESWVPKTLAKKPAPLPIESSLHGTRPLQLSFNGCALRFLGVKRLACLPRPVTGLFFGDCKCFCCFEVEKVIREDSRATLERLEDHCNEDGEEDGLDSQLESFADFPKLKHLTLFPELDDYFWDDLPNFQPIVLDAAYGWTHDLPALDAVDFLHNPDAVGSAGLVRLLGAIPSLETFELGIPLRVYEKGLTTLKDGWRFDDPPPLWFWTHGFPPSKEDLRAVLEPVPISWGKWATTLMTCATTPSDTVPVPPYSWGFWVIHARWRLAARGLRIIANGLAKTCPNLKSGTLSVGTGYALTSDPKGKEVLRPCTFKIADGEVQEMQLPPMFELFRPHESRNPLLLMARYASVDMLALADDDAAVIMPAELQVHIANLAAGGARPPPPEL